MWNMAMNNLLCDICPHRCRIKEGKTGVCQVRENQSGCLSLPFHGYITAQAIDPIEKKPLYHWRQGSSIPSFGFAGCNLRCPFCQNWQISQEREPAGEYHTAEEIIRCVSKIGFPQIAYTYSEPLVHCEFLFECMTLARKNNIANVLVTNACINKEYADEILVTTDAANIDLKCFSEEKYKNTLGGDLPTTLSFIENAFSRGVHIEITTLIVTGFNDTIEEAARGIDFIANISKDIPYHFTAYHPAYKYDAPATNRALLCEIESLAKEKLTSVHCHRQF
jgi:pyruvate formate lyase activating enzyme